MLPEILVRYLHFVGIFCIVGALVSQHMLLAPQLSRAHLRKLAVLDGIYLIGVVLTLGAGLLLWFVVGKPAAFYSQNAVFHTKVTLFVILGLLSVYPTLFFQRNKTGGEGLVEVPKRVVMLIRLELLIVILLPLLATLMARSIGAFG